MAKRTEPRAILETEYGSQTYITKDYYFIPDGRIVFSPAVEALKRTLLAGDPGEFRKASELMLAVEMEYQEGGAENV